MIGSVVFDLDDTLCDYSGAKDRGLEAVRDQLSSHGFDDGGFLERYRVQEPMLFKQFASGNISIDAYRGRRFRDPQRKGVELSEPFLSELNATYMSIANHQVELFDDAIPTIEELRRRGVSCAVLTNGPSDGQRAKLRRCGLEQELDHIFISEELGSAKPSTECFRAALELIGADSTSSLMVGDSLADDIEGARAIGMHAVLIDRQERYRDYQGDRVTGLWEIPGMLERLERSYARR